ncbi:MAG: T9SS type A sorting domain-containing protein [Flavobacterium sp. JAD_PAG50586_2]|nr:MAG: T9SS type A sorting domain-containing protein [Flavobacterium sp. JAD_PAG50586_2]
MKNLIKSTLCKSGLILFLLMFGFSGKAQTQYTMSMTATATTNTIDVSLTITATNPSGVRFGGFSTGINYNTAILNGGTISVAYVPGSKSQELSNLNTAAVNTATAGQIRLPIQALTGTNGVDMAQGTTLNLGTYRITNTVAWAEGSDAALWLQNVLVSGKTNSLVNGYPFGLTTPAVSYTTTLPAGSPGLILGYTQASPLSLLLSLGVDGFDDENFKFSPNPTSGIVNIAYSNQITKVTVMNLLGQTLMVSEPNELQVTFDLTSLPSSTYLVRIDTDKESKIIRVIKKG